MTTIPIAELERAILVLARRGKKAQMMPIQVVKQARNMKSEKTEGIFINFIYGTDPLDPGGHFFGYCLCRKENEAEHETDKGQCRHAQERGLDI